MDLIPAHSIFSPATGFILRGGFDWSCNPYVGCTFGCSYCYAMFLPQNRRPKEDWGKWVEAKHNAVELARRRAAKVAGQAIYMSSVTDPYLPAERTLFLTRGILEALVPHQPRLLVQTRGPLVTRDIDVLQQFERIRVNVSIPTDSERIWRVFEPKAPLLEKRWEAAKDLKSSGLSVGLCLTPLLPLDDPGSFARRVAEFEPDVLVVQDFHNAEGRFGADTGVEARRALSDCGWSPADYNAFLARLSELHPRVYEGESGFFPP
jgi:DNA repair photolyase